MTRGGALGSRDRGRSAIGGTVSADGDQTGQAGAFIARRFAEFAVFSGQVHGAIGVLQR